MPDHAHAFASLSPASCLAARGLLNISQEELASLAGISVASVRRFENGVHFSDYARKRILPAFENEGLAFLKAPVTLVSV